MAKITARVGRATEGTILCYLCEKKIEDGDMIIVEQEMDSTTVRHFFYIDHCCKVFPCPSMPNS